jgi:hypothetical protein
VQEDTALVQAGRTALAALMVTPATFKGDGPAVEIRAKATAGVVATRWLGAARRMAIDE